jgi:hypothetical protein
MTYQPINAPTAGAQAFLKDYKQEKRVTTNHVGPVHSVIVHLLTHHWPINAPTAGAQAMDYT